MCFFTKKWSPKLIFLNDFFFEKIPSIFDIENWLWKYGFGTFWQTINHCRIVLKQFPLSMSILAVGPFNTWLKLRIRITNCSYKLSNCDENTLSGTRTWPLAIGSGLTLILGVWWCNIRFCDALLIWAENSFAFRRL